MIAWLAGQKKNTRITAICGAISSQGSQPSEQDAFFHPGNKAARASGAGCGLGHHHKAAGLVHYLVCFLETLKQLVAAPDRRVERFLGGLLAGPDLLGFLVDDGADLQEVAEADAARLVGGLADHLRHGHVGAGLFLVEARFLGGLEGGHGDRQVAGALVAGRLHFGFDR